MCVLVSWFFTVCSLAGFFLADEEDSLSLAKDNSHNSSFELIGSMLPSYQPINRSVGRGLPTNALRSPSPVFYRPSFLGSASKVSCSDFGNTISRKVVTNLQSEQFLLHHVKFYSGQE